MEKHQTLGVFGIYLRSLLALVTGLIVWAIGGLSAYWYLAEPSPLEVRHVQVLTPIVKPGTPLMLRLQVEMRRECPTWTEQTIQQADGSVIAALAATPVLTGALGEMATITYRVPIPEGAVPGPAVYREVRNAQCNPIRFHVVEIGPVGFEIIK